MPQASYQTERVFGVSKDLIESYVERTAVNGRFIEALDDSRHIVIFGASKQGKSALIQRHVPKTRRVTAHCSPNSSVADLYRALLRQLDIEIVTTAASTKLQSSEQTLSAKFLALLPFGSARAEGSTKRASEESAHEKRTRIEFNLGLAQDVGEILAKVTGAQTLFVLENFHYLEEEAQRQIAFDLRTFEEMGLRFIVLGVWRESDRLLQHNGDLQDRVIEIPVEPWTDADFDAIFAKGEDKLNISLSNQIKYRIRDVAHGSVAIVQELLKKTCQTAGIFETCVDHTAHVVCDLGYLQAAIAAKAEEYRSRYVRSLESIAAGSRTRRRTESTEALYLPYHLVRVILNQDSTTLSTGLERQQLRELLSDGHPTPAHVRTSDVAGLLVRLGSLQEKARIMPPIFDYDRGARRLRVTDSAFYFFLDQCDAEATLEEIPHPDPDQATH